jgi:hypothetical protein
MKEYDTCRVNEIDYHYDYVLDYICIRLYIILTYNSYKEIYKY